MVVGFIHHRKEILLIFIQKSHNIEGNGDNMKHGSMSNVNNSHLELKGFSLRASHQKLLTIIHSVIGS